MADSMSETELFDRLRSLAEKYEVSSFCDSDPSQFLRRYSKPEEIEAASFFTALLSFGSRAAFIPKVKSVFDLADESSGFFEWIKSRSFCSSFKSPDGNNSKKFYRFYSYDEILTFFEELSIVINKYGSLGNAVYENAVYENAIRLNEGGAASTSNAVSAANTSNAVSAASVISSLFPRSKIVPKGKTSANKRIFMFLRWMVRTSSPVDMGLWTWISPSSLVIPLDVHVLEESKKLGLIPEKSPCSIKTALQLTDKLREVWPDDPVHIIIY